MTFLHGRVAFSGVCELKERSRAKRLRIKLEVLLLGFDLSFASLALAAIPLALAARLAAVAVEVTALRRRQKFVRGTVPLLALGGGISIAPALSFPDVPERPALLAATCAVAIFNIVDQGLSLSALARRFV